MDGAILNKQNNIYFSEDIQIPFTRGKRVKSLSRGIEYIVFGMSWVMSGTLVAESKENNKLYPEQKDEQSKRRK